MNDIESLEVLNAIYHRRATRAYTSDPVSRETISELIDAAIHAPSSMNRQEWAFVVVRGKERLEAYSDEAKARYRAQPGGLSPHAEALLAAHQNIFHGAPALIVICATASDTQAAEDCSLAAENLMLAAVAKGYATCPIGFARPWLATAETKRELGIPEAQIPVFPLVIGTAAETPADHGRRAPVVTWIG